MPERTRAHLAGLFGRVADDYERGRPTYPSEAVRWLIGDAQRVIDLGAGTGKLTSALIGLVPEIVAVEPQLSMVNQLKRALAGAHAVCGSAERIPIRSRWADAVVVAQAFHWFDQERAVPEIARVLKPPARLGLIWNVRDESIDWIAELSRLASRDNSAHIRSSLKQVPLFRPFETKTFQMVQVLDRNALLAHVRSRSTVAAVDEAERIRIMKAVVQLCDRHPDLAGKTRFELRYKTQAFRAQKE
jgi:ubiquinone/menaquinone biosynthesis C-methylase UbiE